MVVKRWVVGVSCGHSGCGMMHVPLRGVKGGGQPVPRSTPTRPRIEPKRVTQVAEVVSLVVGPLGGPHHVHLSKLWVVLRPMWVWVAVGGNAAGGVGGGVGC